MAIYTNSKLKLSKKTETISFKLDPTLSFPRKEAGDVVSTQRIDLKLNIADDMRVPEELKALLDGDLNRWTETKYENIWWEKSRDFIFIRITDARYHRYTGGCDKGRCGYSNNEKLADGNREVEIQEQEIEGGE